MTTAIAANHEPGPTYPSRHPNYFGESTLWTGIATLAAGALLTAYPITHVSPGIAALRPLVRTVGASLGLGASSPRAAAVALCYASPAFVTFLLLKVSGVPLSEKKYDDRFGDRDDYRRWKRETPVFVPRVW